MQLPDGVCGIGGAVHVSNLERFEQQSFVVVSVELEGDADPRAEREHSNTEAAEPVTTILQRIIEIKCMRQSRQERRDLDKVEQTDAARRIDCEDQVTGELTCCTHTVA